MGQKQSVETKYVEPEEPEQVTERAETFSLWPGLDHQLELSFTSLDLEEQGQLSYLELEPALRHHLMQIGLIEYITRFAKPDGTLDESEVAVYLREYNIDLSKDLDLVDWKNLILAWIRRVQDAQHDDIQAWQESMAAMQKAQTREYQLAIQNFQQHYIAQLESYYRNVDAVHSKEDEYRQDWEASLGLQDDFYNTQMKYVQERNSDAEADYQDKLSCQTNIKAEYMSHLKTQGYRGPGNIYITRYAYPSDLTETGAPISGGAQLPFKRMRTNRVGQCC